MKNAVAIFSLCLYLTGCASALTPQQLSTMDTKQVCAAAHRQPLNLSVINEVNLRTLSCHPAQEMCTSIKKKKSKQYQECLASAFSQLQEEQMERQQRRAAMAAAFGNAMQQESNAYGQRALIYQQQAMQPTYRPPVQTNCQMYGNSMNCTSQ